MKFHAKTRSGGTHRGGKIGATVFGIIFGSIGLVATLLILSVAARQHNVQGWTPTRCVIESAKVSDEGDKYEFAVRYTYAYAAGDAARTTDIEASENRYTSVRYDLSGGARFESVAKKRRLLDAYAEGTETQCFVNPANPSEAVLNRDGTILPHLAGALFSSVFVLIGFGIVVAAWWPRKNRGTPAATASAASAATGRRIGLAFCSLFILIGVIVPYFTFVRPYQRQQAARQWTPVEAKVEKSLVRSHRGDDSTTYSVYIAYSYPFEGHLYEGDRYTFFGGSSSGYASKDAVVKRHPPGSTITVYVDPADPFESVVQRDAGGALYLGLIPLAFAAFGVLFLYLMNRPTVPVGAFEKAGTTPSARGRASRSTPSAKRASSRFGRVAGMTLAALFWNGIVSIFVYHVVQEWSQGRYPVFLTLFLTPFVLIGAALLWGIVYEVLRLFNPRFELDELAGTLAPGATVKTGFRIIGNVRRLTRLTITLVGREEATYRRGTTTSTDTYEFLSQTRFETTDPRRMELGDLVIPIPADAMHSFAASHNKIVWALKVKGAIPRWPDLSEEFILNVVPKEAHS